ncbi:MAG TPA: pantoate--beta-alanine ligase [Cytophagaceae bacterium]
MKIFHKAAELKNYLKDVRNSSVSIGFVPTMGALHQGHVSLFEAAKRENEVTVGSIFVNPLQFNNATDLEKYPRKINDDIRVLESTGCDVVFIPENEEMYPAAPVTTMSFGALETVMEGKFRPGHFSGVGIVVSKLFNIVQPHKAYFGQKDLQQFLIIKQMVRDLSFPLQLVCCPTLREEDGLAMSSRNLRIPPEKRPIASEIYKSLLIARDALKSESVENVKTRVKNYMAGFPDLELEYFEIADGETLLPIENISNQKNIALCIAAYLSGIRLIDNILLIS